MGLEHVELGFEKNNLLGNEIRIPHPPPPPSGPSIMYVKINHCADLQWILLIVLSDHTGIVSLLRWKQLPLHKRNDWCRQTGQEIDSQASAVKVSMKAWGDWFCHLLQLESYLEISIRNISLQNISIELAKIYSWKQGATLWVTPLKTFPKMNY